MSIGLTLIIAGAILGLITFITMAINFIAVFNEYTSFDEAFVRHIVGIIVMALAVFLLFIGIVISVWSTANSL